MRGGLKTDGQVNLGSEHLDSENIESLTSDILRSHVNDTLQPKFGTNRRRRHTVLTGPSLGDDTGLSNPPGEKYLLK